MIGKIVAPKYIQKSILKMFYHKQVVDNNTNIVNNWITKNNVDRSINLLDLIDKTKLKKVDSVPKGQMSIFDY